MSTSNTNTIQAAVVPSLLRQIESVAEPLAPTLMQNRVQAIQKDLLFHSEHIRQPNFTAIHTRDLEFLFRAYDERFFSGECRNALAGRPLYFTFSRRATKAGGITKRWRTVKQEIFYEIAIATGILFDGFSDTDRTVTACGIECTSRIEALQRIFEHELTHLIEYLCWETSNCAAARFQNIARRFFGHKDHTHNLITRRERAAENGIKVGSRVTFAFEGQRMSGRVHRITKRVTVLVEDSDGVMYTDGLRYKKFYVPIRYLSAAASPPPTPPTQ